MDLSFAMRQKLYFRIALGLICALYFILQHHHGRAEMADFRVYYDAASALKNGETVYGLAFGVSSGFYKYSPLAAAFFIPFTLLPYSIASSIFYCIIGLAVIWFSTTSMRLLGKDLPREKILLSAFFTTLFLADHIERELHLGNVNLLLLLACCLMRYFENRNSSYASGAVYAIVLLFKPHFLILTPILMIFGKFKTLATALIVIAVAMTLPAILCGWDKNFELHQQWWAAMKAHNIALYVSPNTIYGILHTAIPITLPGIAYIIFGLSIAATLILIAWKKSASLQHDKRFDIFFFIAIAAIPNLAHTDTEHFMWTWPLIAFLIHAYISSKGNFLHLGLLIIAFIPYTLNSPDIVGKELSYIFDEGGLLGLANLILLVLSSHYLLGTTSFKNYPTQVC